MKKVRKNGNTTLSGRPKPQAKYPAPRNKQAKEAYYKEYGKRLAQDAIWERKAANYGSIFTRERFTSFEELQRSLKKEGYTRRNRKEVYKKALDLFENNELVRPIINLIASATFTNRDKALDIRGERKDLIETLWTIVDNNELNFHDLAREGELAGDVYLWFEPNGDDTKVWSLDAGETTVVLANNDIRRVLGFTQKDIGGESSNPEDVQFTNDRTQHLKFNSTTTSLYGRSSVRHLFYWNDVKDRLFEDNYLRGAQYYGNPLLVLTGVPGPYQKTVKEQIEAQTQRAGRSWVLPPDTDLKTPDLSLKFPIDDILNWVFRMISIGSEVPITLLGTADASSRGSAFFSNPRFNLAIRPKREVWRIGLRAFFIKLLRGIGAVKPNERIKRKDLDIGFLPIFDKDLADLADLIEIYRDRELISKKTSREMFGIDHSDEERFMKAEPKPVSPNTQNQQKAEESKTKRTKRRSKRNGEDT